MPDERSDALSAEEMDSFFEFYVESGKSQPPAVNCYVIRRFTEDRIASAKQIAEREMCLACPYEECWDCLDSEEGKKELRERAKAIEEKYKEIKGKSLRSIKRNRKPKERRPKDGIF